MNKIQKIQVQDLQRSDYARISLGIIPRIYSSVVQESKFLSHQHSEAQLNENSYETLLCAFSSQFLYYPV